MSRTLSYYAAERPSGDDVDSFANAKVLGFQSREDRDKWLAVPAESGKEKFSVNYRKAKTALKVKKHQSIEINFTDHSCTVKGSTATA
jgi:hypothetical protein